MNDPKLKKFLVQGDLQRKISKGIFSFQGLSFWADPPETYAFLEVSSNAIKHGNKLQNALPMEFLRDDEYIMKVKVSLRACVRGEIFDNKSNSCLKCSFGRYSFDPLDDKCQECPANAQCTGGDSIIVKEGYWRSSTSSIQIHQCYPNQDSCLLYFIF